jgi:hypothetical protein
MDFTFVCDRRPPEQRVIFVKESDPYAPSGQRYGCTAALQSAAQNTRKDHDPSPSPSDGCY